MQNETKKNIIFILKSVFSGLIFYALFALLLAFIKIYFQGPRHPHNMDGLFFILLPLFIAPIGGGIGLVVSIMQLKNRKLTKVIIIQCIGILILTLTFLVFEKLGITI